MTTCDTFFYMLNSKEFSIFGIAFILVKIVFEREHSFYSFVFAYSKCNDFILCVYSIYTAYISDVMVNFFLFLFKLITTKDGTFLYLLVEFTIYSQQRQERYGSQINYWICRIHSKFPYKNKCVTGKQPKSI